MQNKKIKSRNYKFIGSGVEIDLVCGMELDAENAKSSADYKDKTYYFCALSCQKHFLLDPLKYVGE